MESQALWASIVQGSSISTWPVVGEGIPEIQLSWRAPRPSTVSLLDYIVVHLNRPKSPASTAWTFSLAISGGPPPPKSVNFCELSGTKTDARIRAAIFASSNEVLLRGPAPQPRPDRGALA